MKFVDERIEVNKEDGMPVSFIWRGSEYKISKIRANFQDYDLRQNWRLRRHRTRYVVETEEGGVFDIYLDRGAREPTWILYRKIN